MMARIFYRAIIFRIESMKNIWFTSDTHAGHANIIRYCNRPFASVEEMDAALIERWNSVVKPDDYVYHLGDVYFGSGHEILKNLNGRKRLVLGNHDGGKDQKLQRAFQKIFTWRMFPEFGLLMTHVPVHPSTLAAKDLVNVHGHVHQNSLVDPQYRNICVEVTNYTPVHIEELRR